MKRASVSFDQFHVDDRGESKSNYQILLKEFLELQKEFVSRKRKLQAAKKKRDAILAEVRFLRHRHKLLSKTKAQFIDTVQFNTKDSEVEDAVLDEKRCCSIFKVAPQVSDQVRVANSYLEDEMEDGNQGVLLEDLSFTRNSKNYLIHDKRLGKRKISWPDQVTLKV